MPDFGQKLDAALSGPPKTEFEFGLTNGIAYNNLDSRISVLARNGQFGIYHDGTLLTTCDEYDAELQSEVDVIIGPGGTQYVDTSSFPYADKARVFVLGDESWVGTELYKATNDTTSPQVPMFMADRDEVNRYLPGGDRHRHYGGRHLIRYVIDRIDKATKPLWVDTANYGNVLILPGTPLIIDMGDDGTAVAQSVNIEVVK